jgi:hypothetical protein
VTEGHGLAEQIKREVSAFWQMQQRGPRWVRLHPNDIGNIRNDPEYVPPTIAGCPIEVTDAVSEGSPEVEPLG